MTRALDSLDEKQITNDAQEPISFEQPYAVRVKISGAAPLLLHRWSCDDVESKGKAAKGSKAKKTDNLESYVYRNTGGYICIPGEYFRMSVVNAAKFQQDPRSPRKSAMDLFKAGIVVLDELCSLGSKDWDYVDKRRVTIQRNGITRCRPAFNTGWQCEFVMQVLVPEYISPHLLNETLQRAGRLVGVADMRPTYGRFQVVGFDVI